MAKNRICKECKYNNNGWCEARKTNKGLKDLLNCEYRKTDNLIKLQGYFKQKKWEYENIDIEHSVTNKGMLKGLEIAIKIMEE